MTEPALNQPAPITVSVDDLIALLSPPDLDARLMSLGLPPGSLTDRRIRGIAERIDIRT